MEAYQPSSGRLLGVIGNSNPRQILLSSVTRMFHGLFSSIVSMRLISLVTLVTDIYSTLSNEPTLSPFSSPPTISTNMRDAFCMYRSGYP